MPKCVINGIPVEFPFEPYDVQTNYMAKVIDCLQNSTNGVLESPTGTGKTLSLLCASLAWLLHVRSKSNRADDFDVKPPVELSNTKNVNLTPEQSLALLEKTKIGMAKIIYSSRTHSQLSQAMQELKRTHYNLFRAIILGSRDQLCIHREVSKLESNAMKTTMCREKVKARSCSFYTRVEKVKDSPEIANVPILDIEELITTGTKMKACPYYLSKELVDRADMLFMPYNYLLDAKARKSNNLNVKNSVIILDEAHNVEKICEDSGSAVIKSSDIALAIEDISFIMGSFLDSGGPGSNMDEADGEKLEFTMDDLVLLKEMLLGIEKAVDDIPIQFSTKGSTFSGTYIFELLEKANVKFSNANVILQVLNSLITFTATRTERNNFLRRGVGLQAVADFLEIVFSANGPEYQLAVEKCFKVHVEQEEQKKQQKASTKGAAKRADGWTGKSSKVETLDRASGGKARVVNFWCFNPGFGMHQLVNSTVRSIILTSGTLAPLKPLINELSIPVEVCLENPHIVGRNQVYVKIVSQGPDRVTLNSNYANRNNPEYISSLGRTILSFCPVIPGGLLIFFPSYPMMNKCVEDWQSTGMWAQINRAKTVFIEPRNKDSFTSTMTEYYARIEESGSKGAIFMAVCRGKVSEGLDFADANGRAVMITGLPFPPLLDPRVVLKKQYLETNRSRDNAMISGDEWYGLEAARAVNQAIGRVIRHKNDFGAILLCDTRFQQHRQKAQLSTWIQGHLRDDRTAGAFGSVVGELARFFRSLERTAVPAQQRESCIKLEEVAMENKVKMEPSLPGSSVTSKTPLAPTQSLPFQLNDYLQVPVERVATSSKEKFLSQLNCNTHSVNISDTMARTDAGSAPEDGLVTVYKRERHRGKGDENSTNEDTKKKRKLVMIPSGTIKYEQVHSNVKQEPEVEAQEDFCFTPPMACSGTVSRKAPENRVDFLKEIKGSIDTVKYKLFLQTLAQYHRDSDFVIFIAQMTSCLDSPDVHHMLKAMRRFVKLDHKQQFDDHITRMGL